MDMWCRDGRCYTCKIIMASVTNNVQYHKDSTSERETIDKSLFSCRCQGDGTMGKYLKTWYVGIKVECELTDDRMKQENVDHQNHM